MAPLLDPRLVRIARQLSTLELMEGGEPALSEPYTPTDVAERRGFALPSEGRPSETFVELYSREGLERALVAYGVRKALEERGLGDTRIELFRDDAFHHRLLAWIGAGDERASIMDLRIHLRSVDRLGSRARGARDDDDDDDTRDDDSGHREDTHRDEAHGGDGGRGEDTRGPDERLPEALPIVVIEWLSMENPRARFTPERPQLPGQRHPGTGLGRLIHTLLILMTQRLRRHALVTVPEHHHLARLYHRAGYRFADEHAERRARAASLAVADLSFAAGAWAVERGCVRRVDDEGREGAPFVYRPAEMVLPVSREAEALLRPTDGFFRRVLERHFQPPHYLVDEDALAASLRDDPVSGLDPTDLGRTGPRSLEGRALFGADPLDEPPFP